MSQLDFDLVLGNTDKPTAPLIYQSVTKIFRPLRGRGAGLASLVRLGRSALNAHPTYGEGRASPRTPLWLDAWRLAGLTRQQAGLSCRAPWGLAHACGWGVLTLASKTNLSCRATAGSSVTTRPGA
jgi:hypothetical protein